MVQCAKHRIKCFAQAHRLTMTKLPRHRFRSLCGLAGPSWSCRDQGSRAREPQGRPENSVLEHCRSPVCKGGDAAIVSL